MGDILHANAKTTPRIRKETLRAWRCVLLEFPEICALQACLLSMLQMQGCLFRWYEGLPHGTARGSRVQT